MARKYLGWSDCDSLMSARILLFLIKNFYLFFSNEMKSQYKQKSQLHQTLSFCLGLQVMNIQKPNKSTYSFMPGCFVYCVCSFEIQEDTKKDINFFYDISVEGIAPRVLWFIFCNFSMLKMVFTIENVDTNCDKNSISDGWLSIFIFHFFDRVSNHVPQVAARNPMRRSDILK